MDLRIHRVCYRINYEGERILGGDLRLRISRDNTACDRASSSIFVPSIIEQDRTYSLVKNREAELSLVSTLAVSVYILLRRLLMESIHLLSRAIVLRLTSLWSDTKACRNAYCSNRLKHCCMFYQLDSSTAACFIN